jgi:hypothetical protein
MQKFKNLLKKGDKGGDPVTAKLFMEPEVIDDSEWNKDTNEVPFKRKLAKVFGKKSTKLVQDTLNMVVSLVTAWLYIRFTYDIRAYLGPDGAWYRTYLDVVHIYFLLDFLIRVLAAE